jgi:serine/threonine protein kinase
MASGSSVRPSPDACPDENLLVLLAEGALEGEERRAIDRHLDACAECSRLVGHLAKLAVPATRAAPNRYKIIRQIGEGAMGVVWEAEDTTMNRRVALKFVRPEGANDKALRRRLLREARALAAVRHANVVAVYDAGEADDEVCLVLELVEGTNAREWCETVQRPLDEVVGVWRQASAGVAAVHRAGIVHRDIKPDNVFVSVDGRVLVGDFGLATGDLGTTMNLTVTGAVVGTPLYMSPEQLNGLPATAKSDQFALATSIWEAVAGERPFRGTTIGAIALAMTKPLPVPQRAPVEARRVLNVLQRGLEWDPAQRYPSVDAMLAALDQTQARAKPPSQSRGILLFAIGAVVVAALSAIGALIATR